MRKRINAILLAAGLMTASLSLAGCVYAEDQTEAAAESVMTEAEDMTEAAGEAAGLTDTGASSDMAAALKDPSNVTGDGSHAAYYSLYEQQIEQVLNGLSQMSDERIEQAIRMRSDGSVIIATWDSIREDLGEFDRVESYDVDETDSILTYKLKTIYKDAEEAGSKVTVSYVIDLTGRTEESVNWDVKETFSRSVKKAGLNTLIGLGIVFVVLMFLTFLIGQIHWIPDIINGSKKKEEKVQAPVSAPAAPAAEEIVAEDETDDLELAAVIAAAIAASEDVPADGFVVRSIRRRGRKSNWQNA